MLFNIEQKERQKPYLEQQKQYMKEQKKKAQEIKMSKEAPTKKQLYYYEKLCKFHKITPKNTENMSKLDLKNLISEIIEENTPKSN